MFRRVFYRRKSVDHGVSILVVFTLVCFGVLTRTPVASAQAKVSVPDVLSPQTDVESFDSHADDIRDFVEIANRVQLERNTAYPVAGTTVSDRCSIFMNKNMFLGKAGELIYSSFVKHQKEFLFLLNADSEKMSCPNYSKLKVPQRAVVWVVVMTLMAHFESSCNIQARNQNGPNGTAQGFFQLHLGRESIYDGTMNFCTDNASQSLPESIQCTLAMLEKQLQTQKGYLFSPHSYWDVLRPQGQSQKAGVIRRTLNRSALCNPVTS